VRNTAFGIALGMLIAWSGCSDVSAFSCTCGNGTECTITCQGAGSASCGQSKCSGSCDAASSSSNDAVALALTAGLFRNTFIASGGSYRASAVIADLNRLLDQRPRDVVQLGANNERFVVLAKRDGPIEQVIMIPETVFTQKGTFTAQMGNLGPLIEDRLRTLEGVLQQRPR
jgi:hypothetical protein